jgi:hypothetical protein
VEGDVAAVAWIRRLREERARLDAAIADLTASRAALDATAFRSRYRLP